ncbi:uncharacterized protein K489DRAFT_263301 [Dissoconium aciculare CBS 342.82]|uniref:Uncharacterized protein n=1 Tax=Dissoconium aciculare CBS 342.82 TaxID=1314786 RepID=A0A6J3M0K5_9PEZI|nr:uncharacterized protein K489DRAFT_263301 [Dissoconium aciculare CBS 342.82]KAF1821029.1 hypothetical protein K489DRAFT_263301 [Dissoconium aciculare CBS 342.82]
MLPPVESSVLASNPSFDVLYRDLCTNKLNVDGTTRTDAKQYKERESFNEDLRRARILVAKKNLIQTYLPATASKQNEYPDEVRPQSHRHSIFASSLPSCPHSCEN